MKKLKKAVAVFLIASGLALGYANICILFEEGLNDRNISLYNGEQICIGL